MKRLLHSFYITVLCAVITSAAWAGNPDRQGEAGAYELLMNPWARSAGLHTMTTSLVTGVEALQLNVAGLARINRTEVLMGHSIYLQGTDMRTNAFGFGQRMGKNGAFGVSIMALDFGDIAVTTTNLPEGTGATFSPSFFNIGFSYSHLFENKVSVGVTFRGISEAIADVSAFGFAIDAGVQYVTGEQDNFKFGISLRNVGSRMTFGGEGLATPAPSPNQGGYALTYEQRAASFELPSLLNIGLSYDFLLPGNNRITAVGNFTANSFSRDEIGGGLEYSLNELFMLRAGYRYEMGADEIIQSSLYTGPSAGASVELPLSKENKKTRLGIDYAYRQTRVWNGTHNLSVRISI
ncbi:MAG TPA: PorV/PorQ family protein [Saprospiraceae bacterium]|nr:PorV/PorQ family protein [Saprospiraceae bacterium]HMP12569.1 PorV/PorQ family protein [Saprospiraceae bacterium]